MLQGFLYFVGISEKVSSSSSRFWGAWLVSVFGGGIYPVGCTFQFVSNVLYGLTVAVWRLHWLIGNLLMLGKGGDCYDKVSCRFMILIIKSILANGSNVFCRVCLRVTEGAIVAPLRNLNAATTSLESCSWTIFVERLLSKLNARFRPPTRQSRIWTRIPRRFFASEPTPGAGICSF